MGAMSLSAVLDVSYPHDQADNSQRSCDTFSSDIPIQVDLCLLDRAQLWFPFVMAAPRDKWLSHSINEVDFQHLTELDHELCSPLAKGAMFLAASRAATPIPCSRPCIVLLATGQPPG